MADILLPVHGGQATTKFVPVYGSAYAEVKATQASTRKPADGRKTVTTAGTRVTLVASTTPCLSVAITALAGNSGTVVVGGASTVVAALATQRGTPLLAGDSITFDCADLVDIGLDATVSGEGVTYSYLVAI